MTRRPIDFTGTFGPKNFSTALKIRTSRLTVVAELFAVFHSKYKAATLAKDSLSEDRGLRCSFLRTFLSGPPETSF
jgi:hypothetical protein